MELIVSLRLVINLLRLANVVNKEFKIVEPTYTESNEIKSQIKPSFFDTPAIWQSALGLFFSLPFIGLPVVLFVKYWYKQPLTSCLGYAVAVMLIVHCKFIPITEAVIGFILGVLIACLGIVLFTMQIGLSLNWHAIMTYLKYS